jgi:cellobiose phosphorylase
MAFAALGDSKRAWELYALINPLNHANGRHAAAIYKVEPYVIAADVYAVPPHVGRGGWTWYTGSAGWMYRLIVESLLGLKREADRLRFEPCLPATWESVGIDYRYFKTVYHITMVQSVRAQGALTIAVDGIPQPDGTVSLADDGLEHVVAVSVPAVTHRAGSIDLPISDARLALPPELA